MTAAFSGNAVVLRQLDETGHGLRRRKSRGSSGWLRVELTRRPCRSSTMCIHAFCCAAFTGLSGGLLLRESSQLGPRRACRAICWRVPPADDYRNHHSPLQRPLPIILPNPTNAYLATTLPSWPFPKTANVARLAAVRLVPVHLRMIGCPSPASG